LFNIGKGEIMKRVLWIMTLFCLVVLFNSNLHSEELSDTSKTKTTQELVNAQKSDKVVTPTDTQSKATEKKTITQPKGHWSPEFTGKETINVVINVQSMDDIKLLKELGLSCCTDIGTCKCLLTLEQLNEIKTQRINYHIGKDETPRDQDELWLRICKRVDRVNLRPSQIIMASIKVTSNDDLQFLKDIGVDCCDYIGDCKCRISKDQWKEIAYHRFVYGTNVIDTLEWGKETK
jgi:hypothetical protein